MIRHHLDSAIDALAVVEDIQKETNLPIAITNRARGHVLTVEELRRLANLEGLIDSWCKSAPYSGIILARSNSTPARPYMARLRVFNLFICPSVCPLLQGSDTAFRTASKSWRIVLAKRCIP